MFTSKNKKGDGINHKQSKVTLRRSWFHNQLQKEYSHTFKSTRFSGLQLQHQEDDNIGTTSEDQQVNTKNKANTETNPTILQVDRQSVGKNDRDDASSE
jgi:hypothetical protein